MNRKKTNGPTHLMWAVLKHVWYFLLGPFELYVPLGVQYSLCFIMTVDQIEIVQNLGKYCPVPFGKQQLKALLFMCLSGPWSVNSVFAVCSENSQGCCTDQESLLWGAGRSACQSLLSAVQLQLLNRHPASWDPLGNPAGHTTTDRSEEKSSDLLSVAVKGSQLNFTYSI